MINAKDVDFSRVIDIKNREGVLLVSSREVAKNFSKRHDSVLRDIESTVSNIESPQNCGNLFIETDYVHEQNKQTYKEYLLTKDGFSLLVMGFTGSKALQWKLKYIEAFNKMEEELRRPRRLTVKEELKLHYQVIEEQEERISEIDNKVNEMENNMPLFNVECKELQALVRKTGIKTLGVFRGPAYRDNSLRGKVYSDIQNQLKREFGVTRYEAIKRVQLEKAKEIIEAYRAPLFLQEAIFAANNQVTI